MTTNGRITTMPGTIPDRLQPHNLEAEEAVIGSLLIDPDAIIHVSSFLTGADFFIHRHGWIYEAVKSLYERSQPADIITVTDELERRGQLKDVGGSAYLTGLIERTPTSIHAEYYGRIVKRLATRRGLIATSGEIARMAYSEDEQDADELIQNASNMLLKVSQASLVSQPQPTEVFCNGVLDDLEQLQEAQGVTGLKTGLTDLDRITGGLQPANLILIAGRPGMGKSSLGLQIGIHTASKQNRPVLYFSLEMPGKQLTRRMISAESGLDSELIKRGPLKDGDYSKVVDATEAVARWPVYIDDRSRTIEEIRAKSILHHARYRTSLIVIDYLQRIQTGKRNRNDNRDNELGAISSTLKGLAMDLNIPIVAISSLNRQCESRHDKRPMLSDLRESGSLEYDADDVLFLYRDDVYNPDTEYPNVTEINVAKQREGAIGVLSVYFKKHLTTFVDLEVRHHKL